MNTKDVIVLCGEYPNDYTKPNIGNNPNYVFENDPNYGPIRLYDFEENTVFVNSFTECEHYVMGGWNFYPAKLEIGYLTNLNLVITFCIVLTFFAKRFNFFNDK